MSLRVVAAVEPEQEFADKVAVEQAVSELAQDLVLPPELLTLLRSVAAALEPLVLRQMVLTLYLALLRLLVAVLVDI